MVAGYARKPLRSDIRRFYETTRAAGFGGRADLRAGVTVVAESGVPSSERIIHNRVL